MSVFVLVSRGCEMSGFVGNGGSKWLCKILFELLLVCGFYGSELVYSDYSEVLFWVFFFFSSRRRHTRF